MRLIKNQTDIQSIEDWGRRAKPKSAAHWVEERSAYECARSWFDATGKPCVPIDIVALLNSCPELAGLVVEWATPEHRVRFDEFRGEPRNSDLVAIAKSDDGPVAISVEAKADETFGQRIEAVFKRGQQMSDAEIRTNSVARVIRLMQSVLPSSLGHAQAKSLRYQLLTATAGAVAFAIQNRARIALLIIHEFKTPRTTNRRHEANAKDLNEFVAALTMGATRELRAGQIVGPISIPGEPLFKVPVSLYVGKVMTSRR